MQRQCEISTSAKRRSGHGRSDDCLGTWVLIVGGLSEENWELHLGVPDERFTSAEGARNVLCSVVAEMKALNIDSEAYMHRTADGRLHRQQHLKTRLAQWYRLFTYLKAMHGQNVDVAAALLLRTYTSVLNKPCCISIKVYTTPMNLYLPRSSTWPPPPLHEHATRKESNRRLCLSWAYSSHFSSQGSNIPSLSRVARVYVHSGGLYGGHSHWARREP
ncbi:hypothetical protein N7489_002746 [Penicillium chrysogenum]|uniref:Uncharacterized protein n=1 Tax=Penicillium chrysogenum TaxID=5076 RepID=A0ABQ8WML5_PENCH|nr:uncharacterized protein N7489_002746 [Penicillium chrysogenum]KAJ5252336.1 hypothetical protein N7489_002746 [Penicillium chrysogenum]KAJ5271243.1 hypothetical protein N7505_007001 [Penicillium chrysogenum]KAJ6145999.1 hypothetical protein N7497_007981 [Penicillium chrysogenum]